MVNIAPTIDSRNTQGGSRFRIHNKLRGIIVARCNDARGLYCVHASQRMPIHVGQALWQEDAVHLGNHLTLVIAPDDIYLDHPDVLESGQLNQWPVEWCSSHSRVQIPWWWSRF